MKRRILVAAIVMALTLTVSVSMAQSKAAKKPVVAINEIAWAGTKASPYDEWIELKNNTDKDIELTGWSLSWKEDSESPVVVQFPGQGEKEGAAIIPAGRFYLLERKNDNTIKDIKADLVYKGVLSNSGETLILRNAEGEVIDMVNGDGDKWPAGTASNEEPAYASMERVDPAASGTTETKWFTNNGRVVNGKDAEGNPVNGTPGAVNSVNSPEDG